MNIYTTDVDFTFKSTQRGLRTLVQAMKDNRGCAKDWFYDDTVFSWYDSFNAWVGQGLCVDSNSGNVYELEPDGYVPPTFFNTCLS